MAWAKIDIINAAFEELGIASYSYDLQPEQYESALRRLDMIVSGWKSKNLDINYPTSSGALDSDLNQNTNASDIANPAMYYNLAIALSGQYGKAVQPETKRLAKYSLNQLFIESTKPTQMQYPTSMPTGAGNKPYRDDFNRFVRAEVEPVNLQEKVLKIGKVESYTYIIDSGWLGDESLSSFTATATTQATIQSSSNSDNSITVFLLGVTDGACTITLNYETETRSDCVKITVNVENC